MATEPKLLRIPKRFASIDELLECAKRMELTNVLVLSERESGNIVFLDSDLTVAQTNWLLDSAKASLFRSIYKAEDTDRPTGGDAA